MKTVSTQKELHESLNIAIDEHKTYIVTICFTNGIKKKPIPLPGTILKTLFVQAMTNESVSMMTNEFGLICPLQNINEIYWELAKGDISDESKESVN
jgi:hypothetical protein